MAENLEVNTLRVNTSLQFGDACIFRLADNNIRPSEKKRLAIQFLGGASAEIEIEPGPECIQPSGSSIITEVMMWGKKTPDGKGRGRLTLQINVDSAGGQYALLDSTTNDPSGTEGQKLAMPVLINAGEASGVYVGLYPGDEPTLLIQRRNLGGPTEEIRIPVSSFIKMLALLPLPKKVDNL